MFSIFNLSQAIILGFSGVKKAKGDKEMLDTFLYLFGYPKRFFYVTAALETSAALCLVALPGVGTMLLFFLMGGAVYSHAVRQGYIVASVLAWVLMGCCLAGDSLEYWRGGPRSGALATSARWIGRTLDVEGAGAGDGEMAIPIEFSMRLFVLAAVFAAGFLGFAVVGTTSTQQRDHGRVATMSEINMRQAQQKTRRELMAVKRVTELDRKAALGHTE